MYHRSLPVFLIVLVLTSFLASIGFFVAPTSSMVDSASFINNAIANAANSGIVMLKAGTYVVNSTVSLNVSGLTLCGESAGSTVISVVGDGQFVISADSVTIRDLKFDTSGSCMKNIINNDATNGRTMFLSLINLQMYRRASVFLVSLNSLEQFTMTGCHLEDYGQRTWFPNAALMRIYTTDNYHQGNSFIHDNVFRPEMMNGTGKDDVPSAITILDNSSIKDAFYFTVYSNDFSWVANNPNLYAMRLDKTGTRYVGMVFFSDNRVENMKLLYTSENNTNGGIRYCDLHDNFCNPRPASTSPQYPTIMLSEHACLNKIHDNTIGDTYPLVVKNNYFPTANIIESNRFDARAIVSVTQNTIIDGNVNYP